MCLLKVGVSRPTADDSMVRLRGARILTKRLKATLFGWVSRQLVHWTEKVYQNGFCSESSGRRFVTLAGQSQSQSGRRCGLLTAAGILPLELRGEHER